MMDKNEAAEDKTKPRPSGSLFKRLVIFAAYLMMVFAIVSMIGLRFENIDMSETRLFIEFWREWLSLGALLILSAYILLE